MAIAIAMSATGGCTTSGARGAATPTPPPRYWTSPSWDNPLFGVVRDVNVAQARQLGRLTFAPLAPGWSIQPLHALVLRKASASPRLRFENPLALIYRLPRSWGFGAEDTRLLVIEMPDPPSLGDTAHGAWPGQQIPLGRGVTGALTEGRLAGFVTGQLNFDFCRVHVRVMGPAATPRLVTRVGRDLVAAAPKCVAAHGS